MNKAELVAKAAKVAGVTLKDAKSVVDAVFDVNPKKGVIASELDAGRKVTVPGFGTFEVRQRKARKGRNPQTGKPLQIPASKYPAFRAGKTLKDRAKKAK